MICRNEEKSPVKNAAFSSRRKVCIYNFLLGMGHSGRGCETR